MSSLIPFTPHNGQPATPNAAKNAGAVSSAWTPEAAKLHDLDATGVARALPKLLSHPSISAELQNRSGGTAAQAGQGKADGSGEVAKCLHGLGDRLVLIGGAPAELGGSVFLEVIHGAAVGEAPKADPDVQKKLQKILHTLVDAKVASSVRGLGQGGLLVAVVDMLCGQQLLGVKLDLTAFGAIRSDTLLFGECPGRVIVAVHADRVGTVLSESHTGGVSAVVMGEVTAETELALFTRRLSTKWSVAELREAAGIPPGPAGAPAGEK